MTSIPFHSATIIMSSAVLTRPIDARRSSALAMSRSMYSLEAAICALPPQRVVMTNLI